MLNLEIEDAKLLGVYTERFSDRVTFYFNTFIWITRKLEVTGSARNHRPKTDIKQFVLLIWNLTLNFLQRKMKIFSSEKYPLPWVCPEKLRKVINSYGRIFESDPNLPITVLLIHAIFEQENSHLTFKTRHQTFFFWYVWRNCGEINHAHIFVSAI